MECPDARRDPPDGNGTELGTASALEDPRPWRRAGYVELHFTVHDVAHVLQSRANVLVSSESIPRGQFFERFPNISYQLPNISYHGIV